METRLLGELAEIQTGPFGSQLHKEDYVQIGTPIVTVEHLGQKNFTEQNLPFVSDKDKERLNKYILRNNTIISLIYKLFFHLLYFLRSSSSFSSLSSYFSFSI